MRQTSGQWMLALVFVACGGVGVEAGTPVTDAGASDAGAAFEQGDGVARARESVGGLAVDTYTWTDSVGRPRTASLKHEGEGNPGHGGYAVQLTYQVPAPGGTWRTVRLVGTSGGESGFGFFVAHERGRDFGNPPAGTIAGLHGEDDSPLGLEFAMTATRPVLTAGSTVARHTFAGTYPKWGTVAPMADVGAVTTTTLSAHQKFNLPLTITWTFQKGTDFPRIDVALDLGAVTAGQLAFDVRGPYGTLEFADGDEGATLNNVQWGDSLFHFTTQAPAAGDLTTQAAWTWNEPIGGSRRYHGLVARSGATLYELGLVEVSMPALVYGGWSDNRGTTSVASGHGLLSAGFAAWEWPYQSAQYSGLSAGAASTFKKFAWGSSSLYGSANDTQWLGVGLSVPITARPARLAYSVCVVMGVSTFDDVGRQGLTKAVAAAASPACANQ